MTIKKNTLVEVCSRHGTFHANAIEDFDTDNEWYPLVLSDDFLEGASKTWFRGEKIPCRKSFVKYIKTKE
ncbi:hypothetical protein [Treponema sp.]|uniref:hypothetical protein n=1 Tax=Treponema sp. TaxID=166 RepID=UPI003FA2632E